MGTKSKLRRLMQYVFYLLFKGITNNVTLYVTLKFTLLKAASFSQNSDGLNYPFYIDYLENLSNFFLMVNTRYIENSYLSMVNN